MNNGDFDFYIHLDKKVDINTHKDLFNIPNVYFIKNRIDIKWAGFTTAEASLSCIREIVASGRKYDFLNLISGQDYPIKSAAYISDFLGKNIGKEFMLYNYFETEWQEAKARVEKYHFTDFKFKGRHRLESLINLIAPKRKFPVPLNLAGRETFWTLSMECAQYVLNYIDSNPRLQKFLRFTWGPDEFIYQSILLDSPYKDRIVNNNLRYMIWPTGSARPKVLDKGDYDSIMASSGLFGRKFDLKSNPEILDLLDSVNSK